MSELYRSNITPLQTCHGYFILLAVSSPVSRVRHLPRINHFLKHLNNLTEPAKSKLYKDLLNPKILSSFSEKHREAFTNPFNRSFMPTLTLISAYSARQIFRVREDLSSPRRCNVTQLHSIAMERGRENDISRAPAPPAHSHSQLSPDTYILVH